MIMTKRDLVIRISNETGLVQQQVLDVVQKTLDYIAEAVSKGDKVELRNFGVWTPDGKYLLYSAQSENSYDIWALPQRTDLFHGPGQAIRPCR